MIAGIAAYRRHPWSRDLPDPPCLWEEGGSRLLDFGRPEAPPVLVVPSLVNRAHVLDLMRDHSMLRFLAAGGVRPLLLDWGWPGALEQQFTLTDYIAGRLERAITAVGAPLTLVGYCMGGLMAVAAAARRPDLVRRLALLATPWDFWSSDARDARRLADFVPWLEPAFSCSGTMPVDALQMLFSLLDPGSVGAKYRDFGRQDQVSQRAIRFVALEDWLNDGVPLAAPVAREVLGGWYGRNTPARGEWRVAGAVVRPQDLTQPSLVAIPARDRIVPPESAFALAAMMPGAALLRPRAGHIGMIAGSGARTALWEPLLAWLTEARIARNGRERVGRRLPKPRQGESTMADIERLASQHGLSVEAVRVLQEAVRHGRGRMAQFSHPELGGMGQWSAGGMTQVGDMFNTGLRDRVEAVCAALAETPGGDMPRPKEDQKTKAADWWPDGLGSPSSAGSQNGMKYACFPAAHRVAIEQAGTVTIYDSGDHRINGVSQQQGAGQDLAFTSQMGVVRAQDLPVVVS